MCCRLFVCLASRMCVYMCGVQPHHSGVWPWRRGQGGEGFEACRAEGGGGAHRRGCVFCKCPRFSAFLHSVCFQPRVFVCLRIVQAAAAPPAVAAKAPAPPAPALVKKLSATGTVAPPKPPAPGVKKPATTVGAGGVAAPGAKKAATKPAAVSVAADEPAPAMTACELDELCSLRESGPGEKAKREQHIARNNWKPEEFEDVAGLIDMAKGEWEAASISSAQLTAALFPSNFNDMKAVENVRTLVPVPLSAVMQ